jgi:hypothetical protein
VLRNRCHFLGAIAGFTTVAATARDLWSQLVGSIGQRAGPGNRDQWSTVFVLQGNRLFWFPNSSRGAAGESGSGFWGLLTGLAGVGLAASLSGQPLLAPAIAKEADGHLGHLWQVGRSANPVSAGQLSKLLRNRSDRVPG